MPSDAVKDERIYAARRGARAAHPREEHLPLVVIAGAAGDDPVKVAYRDTFAGARIPAFHFG